MGIAPADSETKNIVPPKTIIRAAIVRQNLIKVGSSRTRLTAKIARDRWHRLLHLLPQVLAFPRTFTLEMNPGSSVHVGVRGHPAWLPIASGSVSRTVAMSGIRAYFPIAHEWVAKWSWPFARLTIDEDNVTVGRVGRRGANLDASPHELTVVRADRDGVLFVRSDGESARFQVRQNRPTSHLDAVQSKNLPVERVSGIRLDDMHGHR